MRFIGTFVSYRTLPGIFIFIYDKISRFGISVYSERSAASVILIYVKMKSCKRNTCRIHEFFQFTDRTGNTGRTPFYWIVWRSAKRAVQICLFH